MHILIWPNIMYTTWEFSRYGRKIEGDSLIALILKILIAFPLLSSCDERGKGHRLRQYVVVESDKLGVFSSFQNRTFQNLWIWQEKSVHQFRHICPNRILYNWSGFGQPFAGKLKETRTSAKSFSFNSYQDESYTLQVT